jgi:hypothetical protein
LDQQQQFQVSKTKPLRTGHQTKLMRKAKFRMPRTKSSDPWT